MARWHYLDPPLVCLLPACFAVHVAEEALAGEGLRFWIARLSGAPMPLGVFVLLNAVGLSLFAAGAVLVARRQAHGWVAVTMAAVLVINAVLHIAGTLLTRHYSPGLASATVLYLPIADLVLARALAQAPRRELVVGLILALALHGAVSAVALGAVGGAGDRKAREDRGVLGAGQPVSARTSPTSHGWPVVGGLVHLCGGRVYGNDRSEIAWDVFTSPDPPEQVLGIYKSLLGDTGLERSANGGWIFRVERADRIRRTLDIGATAPPPTRTDCPNAPRGTNTFALFSELLSR